MEPRLINVSRLSRNYGLFSARPEIWTLHL